MSALSCSKMSRESYPFGISKVWLYWSYWKADAGIGVHSTTASQRSISVLGKEKLLIYMEVVRESFTLRFTTANSNLGFSLYFLWKRWLLLA
ncbi:hypothetical protein CEXT_617041 [Caerostris extrusa]|uniref:Uncharacterized protein n=1 Tax=Caerostris extrusa TaxID=172846 RepID=A0AAV4XTU5_CAEEX|nr:hypothetical protein CEXT_617041 [Caerostris extrusa]